MAQSTPSIPLDQAVVTTYNSAVLGNRKASATSVWNTLTDTSTWPAWNRLTPKAIIHSQPDRPELKDDTTPFSPVLQLGTKLSLLFNMNADNETDGTTPAEESSLTALKVVITVFEPPSPENKKNGRLAWAVDPQAEGSWPKWLVYAERVFAVYEDGEGHAKIEDWELQTGLVAYAIRWTMGHKLQRLRQVWMDNLRGFVEAEQRG